MWWSVASGTILITYFGYQRYLLNARGFASNSFYHLRRILHSLVLWHAFSSAIFLVYSSIVSGFLLKWTDGRMASESLNDFLQVPLYCIAGTSKLCSILIYSASHSIAWFRNGRSGLGVWCYMAAFIYPAMLVIIDNFHSRPQERRKVLPS